jgi:hypothetical protein
MHHHRLLDQLPAPGPRPEAPVQLDLAPGLMAATQSELRTRSDGRREAIVLWAGRPTPDAHAVVSHLLLPSFVSSRARLTIPREERHRLATWLLEQQLLIFSDLHTHPREAFLSAADVAAPFSIRDGFYATVIPDFAVGEPGAGWRAFEATTGHWHEISIPERFRDLGV